MHDHLFIPPGYANIIALFTCSQAGQFVSRFQTSMEQSCGFVQGKTYLSTRLLHILYNYLNRSNHIKNPRPATFTFSPSRTWIYPLSYLCLRLRFHHLLLFLLG